MLQHTTAVFTYDIIKNRLYFSKNISLRNCKKQAQRHYQKVNSLDKFF